MTLNIIFSVVSAVYDEERHNCYCYKYYIVMIGSIRRSEDFWGFVKFPPEDPHDCALTVHHFCKWQFLKYNMEPQEDTTSKVDAGNSISFF